MATQDIIQDIRENTDILDKVVEVIPDVVCWHIDSSNDIYVLKWVDGKGENQVKIARGTDSYKDVSVLWEVYENDISKIRKGLILPSDKQISEGETFNNILYGEGDGN